MAFHPDGQRLFVVTSATGSHQLLALDLAQPEAPLTRLFFEQAPITSMTISGDGRFYSVAMEGGEFKIFDDQGRKCGGFLHPRVDTSALSDDGRYFAAGAIHEAVLLVEIESCESHRLFLHDQIGDLAFGPDGMQLSAILLDGTITEWDTRTRGEVDTYNTTNASPNRFFHAFSRESALLASANNSELWIFDLARRRDLRESLRSGEVSEIWHESIREEMNNSEIARLRGHPGTPRLIRFSPDGRLVVSADDRGTVLLWQVGGAPLVVSDTSNEEIVPPDPRMTEATRSDGRLRARVTEETEGCSGDATGNCKRLTRLTLSDTASSLNIATLQYHDGGIIDLSEPWVEFTANGKAVVGRELSKTIWHIDPPHLIARACRIANRPLSEAERDQYLGWRQDLLGGGPDSVCTQAEQR